jgi:hypothetical protein
MRQVRSTVLPSLVTWAESLHTYWTVIYDVTTAGVPGATTRLVLAELGFGGVGQVVGTAHMGQTDGKVPFAPHVRL